MYVLGTAGHVDHGKSALIKALTGIDPDRLPEEKARGLTIDLGFAWYTTADDIPIGIVDVPGHERFVKNMIAGVGAIDFVLFVVAADDGWMPQSAEHLEILRFLGVRRGLIAITKIDLVDPDWLGLVIDDVKDKTSDTFLAQANVVGVSTITGDGLDKLKSALDETVKGLPPREDIGQPRLYIDRAFTMVGRGSVVTGTLIDGSLSIGTEVVVVPAGIKGRIRELQSHKQKVDQVRPGRRVAVNLAGVERSDLRRGECLVALDDTATYTFILVSLTLLPEARWTIKTGRSILAMLGTAEPEAVCRLLDSDEIKPGETGLCELRLAHPVKARLGDRFVLRLPTPEVTIGGGVVLDFPTHRVTRSNTVYLDSLRWRADDLSLPTVLQTEMQKQGWLAQPVTLADIQYSKSAVEAAVLQFVDQDKWLVVPGGYLDLVAADRLQQRALDLLSQYHRRRPFEYGYNESEWREKIRVPTALFKALLNLWQEQKLISIKDGRYYLADFSPELPIGWRSEAETLEKLINDGGMSPPVRGEMETKSEHAGQILNFWISMGRMVALADGVIYPRKIVDDAVDKIRQFCQTNKSITVAQARDLLGTSRKYALPLLTYADEAGLTRREGDQRFWVG